jgi:predicted dehydrogenase
MSKTRVGVIGCGVISGIYFQNLTRFEHLEVVACADLNPELSQSVSEKYPSIKAVSTEQLLADDSINLVVNLTQPGFHYEVMTSGLNAGKHVYGEKPLSISFDDSRRMLDLAARKNLRVGSAPDTFLGAGIQLCRELIDDGKIGTPIAATAFFTTPGHERWHPAPEFYYKVGGGPMLDMGPYYLTALVNLLGSAKSVSGSARITHPQRTITSEPRNGETIDVEIPTHVAGTVDFESGAVASMITSFDVWGTHLPFIEIYGTEGSLSVPNPNNFGDPVKLLSRGNDEWIEIPNDRPFAENSRGLGVADMAMSISENTPHRASGELASHVLEIMHAFGQSSDSGKRIELTSTCERPEPFSGNLVEFSH